jgi:hypothetical protein
MFLPFLFALSVSPLAGVGVGGLEGQQLSPPGSPTVVTLGVYLVGLTRVSPAMDPFPTFAAEVLLRASWVDPRLSFDADAVGATRLHFQGQAAEERLAQVWWPGLGVENENERRTTEHLDVEFRHDGRVEVKERFAVTAHAEVDLKRFPFDHQDFELRIAPFAWDVGQLRLVIDEEHTGHDPDFRNLEWSLESVRTTVSEEKRMRLEEPVSVVRMSIRAERVAGFYLFKLLLPLIVIVVFTWSAFWMTAEPSSGRMQRTFVALLTVVAFHHIVAGHLPHIPYLTFVDAVVYACFASVGGSLLLIVIIHNLEHGGKTRQARLVERAARLLQPAGFALLLTALWIAYHL